MLISILACDLNGNIGNKGKLLTNLSGDLKRFKKITSGKKVLMGRKTLESIGHTLSERTNLIISRNTSGKYKEKLKQKYGELEIVEFNIKNILKLSKKEDVFVIGGAEIYNQLIPFSNKIELTLINQIFPQADSSIELKQIKNNFSYDANKVQTQLENGISYSYITYLKNK